MATDVERLVAVIEARTSAYDKAMAKIVSQANRSAGQVEKRFDKMTSNLNKAFSGISVGRLAGLAGIGLGAADFLKTAQDLDGLNSSLKAITGSSSSAGQQMQFVRDVSDKLGLELISTAQAYTSLLAATKGTALEGQATRDIFVAVANAMATLGKSADDTEGALLAVQQMVSKGTVSAEELRGQLGERLPGAFAAAAKAVGVTEKQLGKLLEQGGLAADQLLPRLADELNKLYGSGRKDTLTANINRLKNSVTDLYQALSDIGGLTAVAAVFESIANSMSDVATSIQLFRTKGFSRSPADMLRFKSGANAPSQLTEAQSAEFDKAFGFTSPDPGLKTTPKPKPNVTGTAKKNEFDRESAQVQKYVEDLKIQAATFGMTEAAAAKYKTQQDLLNAASDAGIKLTQAQIDSIYRYSESVGQATQTLVDLQKQQDAVNDAMDGFGSVAYDALDALIVQGQDLNSVLQDITKSLIRMILQATLLGQGPLAGLFGTSPTGGASTGGLIGSIGSAFLPGRASGGAVNAGQAYRIGENRRPETFVPTTAGRIIPNGGSGGTSIQIINQTPAKVQSSTQRGPNGREMVRLVVAEVKKEYANGGFDGPNKGRYGVTPSGVPR